MFNLSSTDRRYFLPVVVHRIVLMVEKTVNEDSLIREIESKQIREEEAMIDHLVRVFHRESTPPSCENEYDAKRSCQGISKG